MPSFSRRMISLCVIVFVIFMVLYWQPPSRALDLPSFRPSPPPKTHPIPETGPPDDSFHDYHGPPTTLEIDTSKPASPPSEAAAEKPLSPPSNYAGKVPDDSPWRNRKQFHPITSFIPLPTNAPVKRPRVQHKLKNKESEAERQTRLERLEAIRDALKRTWNAYRQNAWTHDELRPITGEPLDTFGGWAATIVDTLDTLWIMGLKTEFDQAVQAVSRIDFSKPSIDEINIFETSIRHLGGLLSAYDLSGEHVLLDKALELGEFLYTSFDTPNRMPDSRWSWVKTLQGQRHEAGSSAVVAELGSLTLEFTHLTQLSGDPKYYDAVARIMKVFEKDQDKSNIPGLWPVFISPRAMDVSSGHHFSLGAMADSLYEYLPKQWALLGGRAPEYKTMYEKALAAAKKTLFFRPLNPWKPGQLLLSGDADAWEGSDITDYPKAQHLTCFVGGMVGLGAQLFEHAADVSVARQLTDGCIWAYNATGTGIAPEIWSTVACDADGPDDCAWSEKRWLAGLQTSSDRSPLEWATLARYPPGFSAIENRIYQLRPEAIESVFYLYRISGDPELRERGWDMWRAIARHTRTDLAYAGLVDVTDPKTEQRDHMESFWSAETLKYFYLLFSEESLISLDDYVFNTEAHPFRLPVH